MAELRAIKEGIQKQTEAVNKHYAAQENQQQNTPTLKAELQIPDALVAQTKETNAKSERREKFKVVIELTTLFAVLAYTTVAAFQWWEMRKTTKATQQSVADADRNFRRDERAWIAFAFVGGNIQLTVGKSFFVTTQVLNTGKTPAKNVEGNIAVRVVKKGEHLEFVYTPGHANYRVVGGTIFPNGSITQSFEGIQHGPEKAEAIVITKTLLQEIVSSESFIVVYGKLTYTDIFGAPHWTTYCRYVTNPSLISEECTRYNNTDED